MKIPLMKMAGVLPGCCPQAGVNAGRYRYVNFRRLLGEAAWARLDPAVRERFGGTDHKRIGLVRYAGMMNTVRCSKTGWLLAQVCRLLGTPLTPYSGYRVPTVVSVYEHERGRGTVWEREYRFPGRPVLTIRSSKCLDAEDNLLESVDGGVRMLLRVHERNGQMVFTSARYFLELAGLRILIPDRLTPGVTEVVHTDLGDGSFRFTLSMNHPWFGEMFFQQGVFRSEEAMS